MDRWRQLWRTAQSWIVGKPQPPAPAGLYTYRLTPEGGKRRLHLRVHADGTGVLFVDVNDVIHLNPTATEMAKLALDGIPQAQAQAKLTSRYAAEDRAQIEADLQKIYRLVDEFRNPHVTCPVCSVAETLGFKPLFSLPARAPYKADLAITYACNNACPHCYNEPDRFEMASLPLADWFRILDKLSEIGIPHLILTGGEPTLHPDLAAIIRYADANGHIVGMNSNGRLLSHRPTMDLLAQAGLNHVQITLESRLAEVHNTMVGAKAFAQTVQGIRNALASSVHTITNTTLTRRNAAHAVETVEFLYDLGVRTFAMNGMIYAGGGFADADTLPVEEMPALLSAVRDRAAELGMRFLWYTVTEYCRLSPLELGLDPKRCNAAEYSIAIEPNGDVLPCQSYYVAAGNLLTDPWPEIWDSALFRSIRNREEDPEAAGLPRKCWDCPDLPMCGGGCPLERQARLGIRAAEHGCARARVRPKAGFVPPVLSKTLRSSGKAGTLKE